MTTAKCPVCLSPGLRLSWERQDETHVIHSFVCSDVNCPRARDPWWVVEPLSGVGYSLLERFSDFARLASLFSCVLLGGLWHSLRVKARRLSRRILEKIRLRTRAHQGMIRVYSGGRREWVPAKEHEEILDQLSELQEASR